MLDKAFIKRKLNLNQQELTYLQEFENITIEEIVKDHGKYAACERFLERLIGRAIDINQYLIAEKGSVDLNILTYRDTFLRLADLSVYPKKFAEDIALSAGLRNALVHDYNNLDPMILEKSIQEAIKEYNDYARYVLTFIEQAQ